MKNIKCSIITLLLVACAQPTLPVTLGTSIPAGSIDGVKSAQLQVQGPAGEAFGTIQVDASGKTSPLQLPAPSGNQLQAAQPVTLEALLPAEALSVPTIQSQAAGGQGCTVTSGSLPENLKVLPLRFVLDNTQLAFITTGGGTYLLLHSNLTATVKATLSCTNPGITENLDLTLKTGWNVVEGKFSNNTLVLRTVESIPGTLTWAVRRDATPPVVEWSVTPDTVSLPELVSVKAQARDNLGMDRMELYRDGVLVKTFKEHTFLHEEGWKDDLKGNHTWKLLAVDRSGQTTELQATQEATVEPFKLVMGSNNSPLGLNTAMMFFPRGLPRSTLVNLTLTGPAGWNNNQPFKATFTTSPEAVQSSTWFLQPPPVPGKYTLEASFNGQTLKASAEATFQQVMPVPAGTFTLNESRDEIQVNIAKVNGGTDGSNYGWSLNAGILDDKGQFQYAGTLAFMASPDPSKLGPKKLNTPLQSGDTYQIFYSIENKYKLGVPFSGFYSSGRSEYFTVPGTPRKTQNTLIAFRKHDGQMMLSLHIQAKSSNPAGKLLFTLQGPAAWNAGQPWTGGADLHEGRNLWWFSNPHLTPGTYRLETTVDGVKESQDFTADFQHTLPSAAEVTTTVASDLSRVQVGWAAVPDATLYEVLLTDSTGRPVTSARSYGTRAELNTAGKLSSGKYGVWVRAWTYDFWSETPRPRFAAASDAMREIVVP